MPGDEVALVSGPASDGSLVDGALFDGPLYAANTAHHRAFDQVVLADAGLRPGARVLDLGCGSGDLTARVLDAVAPAAGGSVLGVDVSPTQVEHARTTWAGPGLEFRVGRAQDLARLVGAQEFDVVLSVAVLHWVPATDQPEVLHGVHRALRPGGTFRADLGGQGQIAAARALLDPISLRHGGSASPWFFPNPAQYRELLEGAGLQVHRAELVEQRRALPGADDLVGWLRSQVLPAYLPGLVDSARESFVREALDTLPGRLRRPDGTHDQDYVRLDVLAARPRT